MNMLVSLLAWKQSPTCKECLVCLQKGILLWSCAIYFFFRFCGLVKEILSDAVGGTLELEGEIDGDTLEVCHR